MNFLIIKSETSPIHFTPCIFYYHTQLCNVILSLELSMMYYSFIHILLILQIDLKQGIHLSVGDYNYSEES